MSSNIDKDKVFEECATAQIKSWK